MADHDYPLQALLYSVALHRYLCWRLVGYQPATHLGGVVYLFLRGMTGPSVAFSDGEPHGVFGWAIPPPLVVALSQLLDGQTVPELASCTSPGARVVRWQCPPDVAVLAPFVDAGVFGSFEVQLAATMMRLLPDISGEVIVALAVAARAPRFRHVCAELRHLDSQIVEFEQSADGFRLCRGLRWMPGPGHWPDRPSCLS